MEKQPYVNEQLLADAIKLSGYKFGYLADVLGITRQGFMLKRQGVIPFRKLEKDALAKVLNLSDELRDQIFLQ